MGVKVTTTKEPEPVGLWIAETGEFSMAQPRFQLVPGSRLAGNSGPGGVGWRLLGSNNRELGRSSSSFPDAEAALASINRLRVLGAQGRAHILHDPDSGLWAWRLDDGEVHAANSGRGFRHEREARYNLDQFHEAAPTAPASDRDVRLEFPWQRSVLVPAQPEASS
jgi:hypothetical protein